MKILVVSDSHGRNDNMIRTIKKVSPIDMMLHLGDIDMGPEELEHLAGCKVYAVCGNNDFLADYPKELLIEIGKHKVFMTHGHRYRISYGLKDLAQAAKSKGADTVLYGHTHVVSSKIVDGILMLNPGSISLPREYPYRPSFMIIETDSRGEMLYGHNYL